jgi:hypothetical protein
VHADRHGWKYVWVTEHHALTERQYRTNDLPQEGLRFQAWVRCDGAFVGACRVRADYVPKWLIIGYSPKSACLPLSEVVLHAALDGLSKQQPRLIHGAWKHADVRKLLVCVLGPVATPHGHHEPNDFASPL